MTKFAVGDKVRVKKGSHAGDTGVVLNPAWAISQSDWPSVQIAAEDGHYALVNESNLEYDVDPYEYTYTWKDWNGVYYPVDNDNLWDILEVVKNKTNTLRAGGRVDVKIMRRLKAGEPEDFELTGDNY